MHSTTCGIGASTSNGSNNSTTATTTMQSADGLKMGLSNNDDALNKIPLKSVTDDEEKHGEEFIHDTASAEEARREQRRLKLLNFMKKLTIGLICFIGIALISYVIISLCFSEWPKSGTMASALVTTTTTASSTSKATATATTTTKTPSTTNLTNFEKSNYNTITTITPTTTTTTTTTTSIITSYPSSLKTISTSSITSTIDPLLLHMPSPLIVANTNLTAAALAPSVVIPPTASPILSIPSTFHSSLSSDDDESSNNTSTTTTSSQSLFSSSFNVTPSSVDLDPAITTDPLSSSNANETTGAPPELSTVAEDANVLSATTTKTLSPLKDSYIEEKDFTSKLGVYEHAAVCSDKPICSQIGSNILEEGGSAVDSAIAALLCNGIVTMQSMGIGGGMLMNIFIKSHHKAYTIDGREVAPFQATTEYYKDVNSSDLLHGPLAIAVPGELMGYYKAHDQFGKLPWRKLVEPSLELCKDGFYITKHQHNALGYKDKHMRNNTVLRKMFYNETTNSLHPEGTKIKPAPELCNTYELLAENGPLDFYNGTLAKLVSEDLRELGSLVEFADLETYTADLVSSVTMQLGDDLLYAVPPISSGTIIANILSILEGYNFTKADLADAEHEATTIHRFAEALKFGFAKRWELGDARMNDMRDLVSRLTNPETGHEQRMLINDSSVLSGPHDYGAQFSGEDDVGTSALVVMAPNGDAVSVTSSINDYFGSGLAGKRTGIVFNSAMNDFSLPGASNQFKLPPSPINFIAPQKRPMSSMSPMILADQKGNVKMAISAAGGSKIISAIVEVMARVLWMNDNIKEAIDAPRYHHQLIPNVLEYEKNEHFTEELLKLLSAKGHSVKAFNYTGSVVCGVVKNDTAIYANADYRKRGGIVGY